MGSSVHPTRQLHVAFLPYMVHGHLIPIIHIVKLFASRGVKCTIVTTHLNGPLVSQHIQTIKSPGTEIEMQLIRFPAAEAGLPEQSEKLDFISSEAQRLGAEFMYKFFRATALLREPLERVLELIRPDCLVADILFSWTTDAAAKFGIPRLVFHGTSFFSLCIGECLRLHQPDRLVSSDSDPFVVPGLPGKIQLTRSQLPESTRNGVENALTKLIDEISEAEVRSYGMIVNSFRELEPDYADFYGGDELGRRNWAIGPVSMCDRSFEGKTERVGGEGSGSDCLKWLDSKDPNSVIYICFGSIADFADRQLKEIALALESWGGSFMWVVRKDPRTGSEEETWLPNGFQERMESGGNKGLIIRGWAPQVLILDHVAVGGFMTHCGWNSTLEGIVAGKAMVTWPVASEQFYNEKLLTTVLGIGAPVGAKKSVRRTGDEGVKAEGIENAVRRLMEREEGEGMRRKAKELGEKAKMAVEEGGSSHSSLNDLIDELKRQPWL